MIRRDGSQTTQPIARSGHIWGPCEERDPDYFSITAYVTKKLRGQRRPTKRVRNS